MDQCGLLEESLLVSPVGSNTPFKDIKKLLGYTWIKFSENQFREFSFKYLNGYKHVTQLSFDEMVSQYSKLVTDEVTKIKKAYHLKTFALHQTGGLDNRTVFAAMMSSGIKPMTLYGIGNTSLTNTNPLDLEIVKLYEKFFGLRLHIMDWSHEWKTDRLNWDKQVFKYGFFQSLYGGSSNFFNEYERNINPIPDFVECGYFGEVLRQREWAYQGVNSRTKGYNFNQFLCDYLFGPGYGGLLDDRFSDKLKEIRESIRKSYLYELQKNQFKFDDHAKEQNFFSIDDWNKVEWVHMRNGNSQFVSFLNLFTSSIAIFSTEQLHDFALNVPAKYLQNGKFQLAVINKLYPEALKIPILSHGKKFHYITSKGLVPSSQELSVHAVKSIIKSIVYKNKLLRGLVKNLQPLMRRERDSVVESEIRNTIYQILGSSGSIIHCKPSEFSGSIVYLCILANYVNAVRLAIRN